MKKIEAIIRKTKFEDVKEALLAADIEWFSYYDVRGEGKMRQARIYRGVMYDTSSIERVLMNIVVRDKNVDKTVKAITDAARTGEIGDGRIFIVDDDRLDLQRPSYLRGYVHGCRGWLGGYHSGSRQHGCTWSYLHRTHHFHDLLLHGGCREACLWLRRCTRRLWRSRHRWYHRICSDGCLCHENGDRRRLWRALW